ncbi:hypothetical protein [Streptomyces sp. WZ-12]|uniref:hypothetical protein n=1 Tax=Streptomyces sp. WZ-12 TaxID=3030210 RepID=UPI002380F45A|nr:hypothetical protein [Streptomyces sp. WZ-12]
MFRDKGTTISKEGSRASRGKKLGRALAVGASVVALASVSFVGAGPAYAGSNGQMVGVSTRYYPNARVCGNNQNNVYTCTPWFRAGSAPRVYPNYWFKGYVQISSGSGLVARKSIHVYVPVSQGSDYFIYDGFAKYTL